MLFTNEQIEELIRYVEFQHTLYIGDNIGHDILTNNDKLLLESFGIDINARYANINVTPAEQAYYFGKLSAALGHYPASKITYNDFKKFIQGGGHIPLTKIEQNALKVSKQQSYAAVKNLGHRVGNFVTSMCNAKSNEIRAKYESIIRDETKKTILYRRSLKEMAIEIGKKTGDWNRDLDRVVETEMHNTFEQARAMTYAERGDGGDTLVYKTVYPLACRHCVRLYLTNGVGSEPRIFKLKTLQANGTNVGRKTADWKAVVGATHPYCFDKDTEVLTDRGWQLFKHLDGNELILSIDLDSGDADWIPIKHIVKYRYIGGMHHFHNRKFDKMVTPDHMNVINTPKLHQFRLVHTVDMPKSSSFLRTIPNWIGTDVGRDELMSIFDKYDKEASYEFFGYYLSEGSCSYHGRGGYQVKIAQSKYIDEMSKCAQRLFNKVWIGKDFISIPVSDEVGAYFQSFGHAHEKFLPNWIRNSTKDMIKIFLDAFNLGDGSRRTREHFGGYKSEEVTYYTSSPLMSAQIGEMILKVGGTPSYSAENDPIYVDKKKNKTYKSVNPVYTIRHNKGYKSGRTYMTEDIVDYDDYVYDVELEKWHTLITRRNGKVVVSGNCRCTLYEVPDGYKWDKETGGFTQPVPTKRKSKVKRGTIKVTIGDEEYII